jgi:hypothetical protein
MPQGTGPMLINSPIRTEIKESIILLVFSGLLANFLTIPTVIFVFLGAFFVWIKKNPGKWVRNIFALGLFSAYWITYGKIIDPEVGLNFLTSIIVMKLLEKESDRDRYMIFFGLILLISAGALFQKSLSYVFFFALSFFILIQDFYHYLKLPSKVGQIFKSVIWVMPFTVLIFFFAPRAMSPLNINKGAPNEGEVGYTPDVNISSIEALAGNDEVVFQAQMANKIKNLDLYWRGNTLSFSDGWNWPLMPQDTPQSNPIIEKVVNKSKDRYIKQTIRMHSRQDFFFGLDHPVIISTPDGEVDLGGMNSLSQNRWQHHFRYNVFSEPSSIIDLHEDGKGFLRSGLKNNEENWVHQHFKSYQLPDLEIEIRNYFKSEGFTYSLSPGRVSDFLTFMESKKIGFCSHFSSAVALILRTKKIKTRLVSGFQGGAYNEFAGLYQVTQNDAHVWLEAYHNGKWKRLDPTEWIAPDRVILGGDAFIQQTSPQKFSPIKFLSSNLKWLYHLQQRYVYWEFQFYQFLDQMDFYGQTAFLEKLKIRREWLFTILPMLIALFMGAYMWQLSRSKNKSSDIEKLWVLFKKKMSERGMTMTFFSIEELHECLKQQDELTKEAFNDLVQASFSPEGINLKILKKKITSL